MAKNKRKQPSEEAKAKRTAIILFTVLFYLVITLFVGTQLQKKKTDEWLNQEVTVCYKGKAYQSAKDGKKYVVELADGVCVKELYEDPLPVCEWMDDKGICHN